MRRAAAIGLFLAASTLCAAPCTPSATRLCLNGGRFSAQVSWRDFQGNTGSGQAISLTGDTGYFWFFSANNVELIVKVLDGRALNSHFWVFYGALSNVEYTLTVTDSVTGTVKSYVNPSARFGSVGDTEAFSSSGAASPSRRASAREVDTESASNLLALQEALLGEHGLARDAAGTSVSSQDPTAVREADTPDAASACVATSSSLCLNNSRFRVSVTWRDFAGNTGAGTAVTLTGDTGYFWFFSSNNVELAVKVLDARVLNDAFWVFYGALSNVQYTITVTDTSGGTVKTYTNPSGNFGSVGDTSAFPQHVPLVKSSEQLVDEDRKAGAITEEQALVYRVYTAFGSPSLPAKYRSTAPVGIDLPIATAVAKRYPTLSAGAQAAIRPYLFPPVYAGSWGDPAFVTSIQPHSTAAESASVSVSLPAVRAPERATDVCSGPQAGPLPGWAKIHTQHFNVWYRTVIPPGYQYSLVETSSAATNVAAVADAVFDKITGNFQVPLTDMNESCNGGDAALDVYMDKLGFGALAQTMVYGPGCAGRPTWMWINPLAIQDATKARDVFAHEFMHMVECAYSRGTDCEDYVWLEEAAANWAIDFVYPADQYEHNAAGLYYATEFRERIEKGLTYAANGYSDYVFLFFLSHKLGPAQGPLAIKHIWEDAQLYNSLDSLEQATSAFGGLKVLWPQFVTAGWNDAQAHVADDLTKWDSIEFGEKKSFDDHPADATPVDMRGLSEKTFDDLGDFGTHTIEPLAARYVYLKFPDASARYLILHNKPAELAATKPHLHIRALQKINGQWRAEEDWTNAPIKTFCRDAKAERIEELVLMYSNSNPDRPAVDSAGNEASRIYLDDQVSGQPIYMPTLEVSNIGCFRWTGTASVTTAAAGGGFSTIESATATFDRFRFPGTGPEDSVGFDAFKSTNTGTATYQVSGSIPGTSCTISGSATGALQGDGELLADAGFIATFLQPGSALNRKAIGSGTTLIPNVHTTITCPGSNPEVTIGDKDVRWFLLPDEGAVISQDGQIMVGNKNWTDSDGDKQSSWIFRSQREE
ncbi:MAG: hypothetical protein ABI592_06900 [Acidobacteriota bacterium]